MMPVRIKRGGSSTCALLVWSIFGGVLLYAFNSNFLSMLVSPSFENTLDTGDDILEAGMSPISKDSTFYKSIFETSTNPTMIKLGKTALYTKEWQPNSLIIQKVLNERTHAWLIGSIPFVEYLPYRWFHKSRESIGSAIWSCWIVNKQWKNQEQLQKHILFFQQVNYNWFGLVRFILLVF